MAANQVARGHQEIGHKSLLQSNALYQYILESSVYPREPEPMKELRELTAQHLGNIMTTPANEVLFLNTDYSLLVAALSIHDTRKILAMDINRENYELHLPVIQKAGVAHKIDFREGPTLSVLDQMIEDVSLYKKPPSPKLSRPGSRSKVKMVLSYLGPESRKREKTKK